MSPDDFIAAEVRKPFAWGETDCAMTASRWVESATGVNPISEYGRLYTNERQARAWLSERGGIAVAMNRVMREAGFTKTAQATVGDVGLVFHGKKLCAAIFTGAVWFSRDADGLIGVPPAQCWKIWTVG